MYFPVVRPEEANCSILLADHVTYTFLNVNSPLFQNNDMVCEGLDFVHVVGCEDASFTEPPAYHAYNIPYYYLQVWREPGRALVEGYYSAGGIQQRK